MPIKTHPKKGSIIRCDFNQGFVDPEMVKLRPVIVISPPIENFRPRLCTVVALSTTPPKHIMPYHLEIKLDKQLPKPYDKVASMWVKGDMINAVGFHRLDLLKYSGRDDAGKRKYYLETVSDEQMKQIHKAILSGLGLARLTKNL
jgi:uncharacterized protein YifN (PemK superfamily)